MDFISIELGHEATLNEINELIDKLKYLLAEESYYVNRIELNLDEKNIKP